MAAAPLVIAGAGMALSAYGQIEGGEQRAAAARDEAANKRLQAEETLRRAQVKSEFMQKQGDQLLGSQASAYGHAGVELSGSALLTMEDTASSIRQEIEESQKEAAFRARQLQAGANFDDNNASDYQNAGYIGAGGTILTGAGSLYRANKGGGV